jgi:hypothetical protein
MTDQRQGGALDAVGQLVGQLDRERDRQRGDNRLSASIKTHAGHATANLAACLPGKKRPQNGGVPLRLISHF